MRRGEIYWADLAPRSGAEQAGRRPVVLVSRDAFNRLPTWRSVNVVPLSTSGRRAGPTSVLLPAGTAGLTRDSLALCHQITTLDREKLSERLGILNAAEMGRLDHALKLALELD
jgi:mRNA interferase MazF